MFAGQPGDGARRENRCGGGEDAQSHAARQPVAQPVEIAPQRVDVGQDAAGAGDHRRAGGTGTDAARVADEQRHAGGGLHGGDLARDGGLRIAE